MYTYKFNNIDLNINDKKLKHLLSKLFNENKGNNSIRKLNDNDKLNDIEFDKFEVINKE